MAFLAQRPDVAGCVTHAQNFWISELRKEADQFRDHRIAKPLPGHLASTLLARRAVFETVGPFDTDLGFGHSADWFLRAAACGITLAEIPEVLYYRRLHHTNRSRQKGNESREDLQHPWGRRARRSEEAVGLYLRLGYIPAPFAFLRDSHQLEPGTWLSIDAGGHTDRGRFFGFPEHREPDLHGEEAADAVATAVDAAVRRHLIADVPVGTFLSGGIDSPLITASAHAAGGPRCAFTLGTGGDRFDESANAAAYAREIGIEHIVAHLIPAQALDMIDDVAAACAEPFADYSLFPTLAVSRLARERVKVVLSGDGGDELFWGYVGRLSALLGRLDARPGGGTEPRAPVSLDRLLSGGHGQDLRWPGTIGDLHRLNHLHGSEGWLQRLFPDLPPWPADLSLFTYSGRNADATARWLRWNEFTGYLTMILQKVDRGSMFHGLEARAPLLDREVIDVASRIDWRTCLDPGQRIGKIPLRRALARRVRHQTVEKRGFTVPMDEWLRGPLRALFADTVATRTELAGLPLDRAALGELLDRHAARRNDYGWLLWVLLSLALWEDRHCAF